MLKTAMQSLLTSDLQCIVSLCSLLHSLKAEQRSVNLSEEAKQVYFSSQKCGNYAWEQSRAGNSNLFLQHHIAKAVILIRLIHSFFISSLM